MEDTRLKVFYAVATHLSFTKAASLLCLSQPAVTKHIANLESQYQVKLFERNGHNIKLTAAGVTFLEKSKKILSLYNELSYAMHAYNQIYSGKLRLGASTTIAQYILPEILALFNKFYPDVELTVLNDNSQNIERALIEEEIDLGLVENVSRSKALNYTPFLDDNLILVNADLNLQTLTLKEFKSRPLILRERGSGTLDAIISTLHQHHLKLQDLNVRMHLGSTEAIKRFLMHSNCLGIVSKFSVKNELEQKKLKDINLKGVNFKRQFCFVKTQGEQLQIIDKFTDFVKDYLCHNL
ncbi:MAG: LysR family transcriptional regulator [Succinatimonas sp.]|nr:LysR family transcriptional regulator [Succinatimonas sp.]